MNDPSPKSLPFVCILGVPVSIVNLSSAVEAILSWCAAGRSAYICIRDVHGIMRAQNDLALREIHNQAGLVTPDGMPLVWVTRLRGYKGGGRVAGSDLVESLCEVSPAAGLRHYFYGAKPGVAERMATALQVRYPGLSVVGASTPPFGDVSADEDARLTAAIASARPDVIWVGLSTPKQEYWMRDHVGRIPGATLIGIGAAFDFLAGEVKRAPRWMQISGLEWLHRLASEPRRLWKRYILLAPIFAIRVMVETAIVSRERPGGAAH